MPKYILMEMEESFKWIKWIKIPAQVYTDAREWSWLKLNLEKSFVDQNKG